MKRASMQKVFKQGFSTFLRRRRVQRHFERHPLLDALVAAHVPSLGTGTGTGTSTGTVSGTADARALGQDLLAAAQDEPAAALARLQSQADGLDSTEAARRLARDGPNEVAHEPPLPAWLHLWRCYLNPFNVLLTVLAVLSYVSADSKATVVIGVMVALSTEIGRAHV